MPEIIRAFIVVIVLASVAFYLGRQLANGTISPSEFRVWRNVWFVATAAGFLAGNFYIYAFVVAVLVLYTRAVGALSPALYLLLLFVVPPVNVTIGGMGMVNKFLELNNPGLLAALILLPILFSVGHAEKRGNAGRVSDFLIICYVLLIVVLQFRNSSATNVMRMMVVYTLGILLPYFTFSRAVTTTADVQKVLMAFVLAALPLCLVAVFETVKGWLLYYSIVSEWGGLVGQYLPRAGKLRAVASAMHPIALGFVLMVAMGCYLVFHKTVSRNVARFGFALLGAGLVAPFSRGPWVGAAVLVVTYLATGPSALTKLAKLAAIGFICLAPLLMTPVGARLLDFLPFVGSVEAENVEYRQRLITNSLIVAKRHPWFGSVDYRSEPEMQELIQGQGIVDVVNTYLGVALEFGMVGLTLFLGLFASILLALRRALRSAPATDPELRNLLRASMATMVAILVGIGTLSSISYIPHVYWSFAGLCVAIIRIAQAQRSAAVYQLSPSKVAA